MKIKTLLSCLVLVAIVGFSAWIMESVVAGMIRGYKPPGVEKIFPLSSLPFVVPLGTEAIMQNAPDARYAKGGKAVRPKVTLYLKNGNVVSGEIVSEEAGWITLNMEGSYAGFPISEIKRMEKE